METQKQINLAKMQVEFLENTLSFISLAESLAELERIKEDLIAANYYKAKQIGAKKKRPQKSSISPATFVDENGNKLFVGRNSKENEYIVSKVEEKNVPLPGGAREGVEAQPAIVLPSLPGPRPGRLVDRHHLDHVQRAAPAPCAPRASLDRKSVV